MSSIAPGDIEPPDTIQLGQFQSAVGFDLRTVTPEGLVARVGRATATWEPESVHCEGGDGTVFRIHQDPSGAVVRFGEGDLAFGFAPGGPARCAAVGRAQWTRGWAVGVMSADAEDPDGAAGPEDPDGEEPTIGDDGRRIAFLPIDRRMAGEAEPAVVLGAFDAGKPIPCLSRVRLTWLFRSDVVTSPADGTADADGGDASGGCGVTGDLPGEPRVVELGGVIEESHRLVNTLTGRGFRHLRVRVGDQVVDACAPEREGGPDFSPGRIVRGAALATGFTDGGPGNPGIVTNDAFLDRLEFPGAPEIVTDSAMHVLADPADCLGLPMREPGDIAARLFGGRAGHRLRAEEEVIVGPDVNDAVTTRVLLDRVEEDGVGLVVSVPEGLWGAYVDGSRIGDRSRLHLAGVDVLVTEHRDTGFIPAGAEKFTNMCRRAFRRAVTHQRITVAARRSQAKFDDPEWFAARGVDVLDESRVPEYLPDGGYDDGPDAPLAHGTRIPVCSRILGARWRPTLLNIEDGDDPGDLKPEFGRIEVDIEVGGQSATLHLPGDADVVPVGGHVFGWAQVCGNGDSAAEVTESRRIDGFPGTVVRPFRNGYEDEDVPAGELLAMAGPVVDQMRAMALTSCGPVTAPHRLHELAESLGLHGEVDDDGTFRLGAPPDGASVVPVDGRQRQLLLRLVEDALGGRPAEGPVDAEAEAVPGEAEAVPAEAETGSDGGGSAAAAPDGDEDPDDGGEPVDVADVHFTPHILRDAEHRLPAPSRGRRGMLRGDRGDLLRLRHMLRALQPED